MHYIYVEDVDDNMISTLQGLESLEYISFGTQFNVLDHILKPLYKA
jgi:hypothetical protein